MKRNMEKRDAKNICQHHSLECGSRKMLISFVPKDHLENNCRHHHLFKRHEWRWYNKWQHTFLGIYPFFLFLFQKNNLRFRRKIKIQKVLGRDFVSILFVSKCHKNDMETIFN